MKLLYFIIIFACNLSYGRDSGKIETTIVKMPDKTVTKIKRTKNTVYKTKIIYKTKIVYRTKIIYKPETFYKIKNKNKKKEGLMIGSVIGYGPRGIKKIDHEDHTTVDQEKSFIFGGRVSKCISDRYSLGISVLNNSSILIDLSLGLDL